jgi:23S rRNA (uracil1939-C5)-methyltransferase
MENEITLSIERLGIQGEGVGYVDGFVFFVTGALPGEVVRARISEKRKSYGRAELFEVLTASPHRVAPVCKLFGQCGGCQLMHLDYPEQLTTKRQRVVDAFERIGKLSNVTVLPCEPSAHPLGYRNKIQLPVVPGPSHVRLGLYAAGSHDLVEIEECHIHTPLGDRAFSQIKQLVVESGLSAYNPQTGKGELRHILIKTAVNCGEILVILVSALPATKELKELAEKILQKIPEVKGVVHNLNEKMGNVILGEKVKVLAGQEAIYEKLCGLSFKVSPLSFFQVNPSQAEKLYRAAAEQLALTGEETLLDAYCGVGTLSLILAKRAKKVIGIECVPQAIEDAEENAKLNQIKNVAFTCGLAEEVIASLERVDAALLNPPRKGCESSFLQKLIALAPKRIVYISCDPATLARDLSILTAGGYTIDFAQPFDMFPQTAHVECLVSLTLG